MSQAAVDSMEELSSPHRCFSCENRASATPMSPAQSYPSSTLLSSSTLPLDDLAIITNKDGLVGMSYIEITDAAINGQRLTDTYASCDACGAISTFIGVTRNHFNGKPVARLEYEAYTSMALKQMGHIVKRIFKSFDQVHRVVMSHRIGVVPVKEASVFIAVSTEHRQSGLDAVAFAINTLKAVVPVWKREFYVSDEAGSAAEASREDGGTWKRNQESLALSAQRGDDNL